jgi:hypothetical protein
MDIFYNNTDKIKIILLMLGSSLYIRLLLQIMGQSWIKTIAHTATLSLLPILTYVITSVISGNIALSLGMVGALSIVRFRNPVRSPLELSVYFGAITMGITASVSIMWLLLLISSVTLVSIILFIINYLSERIIQKPFFISSFSEGNSMATLNVVTKNEIHYLNQHKNLMSKNISNGEISYTLACIDFVTLQKIENNLQKTSEVQALQLNR